MKKLLFLLAFSFIAIPTFAQDATDPNAVVDPNAVIDPNAVPTEPVIVEPPAPPAPAVPYAPISGGNGGTQLESNIKLSGSLSGSAGFTFGVDITSMGLNGGTSVEGLRNDASVSLKLEMVKTDSYEKGEKASQIVGWIKLKDLGLSVTNSNTGTTLGGGSPSVEARIYFIPSLLYLDVLGGGNWSESVSGTSVSLSSSNITKNIGGSMGLSLPSESIKMENLLIASDTNKILGYDSSISSAFTRGTPEHAGIALGFELGSLLKLDIEVASRYDWSTGSQTGKNWEKANAFDIQNPSDVATIRAANDVAGQELKKNFGHDWMLGFDITSEIAGIELGIFGNFALGDWDDELMVSPYVTEDDAKYNIFGYDHKQTVDPMMVAITFAYGLDDLFSAGDVSFSMRPYVNFAWGLGEYTTGAAKKDQYTPVGGAQADHSDQTIFMNTNRFALNAGLDFTWSGSETKNAFRTNDTTGATGKSGVSVGFGYDGVYHAGESINTKNGEQFLGGFHDHSFSFELATFESANGGLVPYFGWGLSFEMYNLGRDVGSTGAGSRNVAFLEAETVANTGIYNKDLRWTMGLELSGYIPVMEGSIAPVFQMQVLENGTAMKTGFRVDFNNLVKNTVFFAGWDSDKMFFNDAGKMYHGYTQNDFGVVYFGAKINF